MSKKKLLKAEQEQVQNKTDEIRHIGHILSVQELSQTEEK